MIANTHIFKIFKIVIGTYQDKSLMHLSTLGNHDHHLYSPCNRAMYDKTHNQESRGTFHKRTQHPCVVILKFGNFEI